MTRALPLLLLALSGCELIDSLDSTSAGDWSLSTHPCLANRTDTLWMDDADTAFVACGSGTVGYGAFVTTNGGSSWELVDPALEDVRINTIFRGEDGLLYLGGTGSSGRRVFTYDGSTLATFYAAPTSGAQTWQTFQVGNFRIDADGRAVSESLTGSDVIYWSSDGAEPSSGYGWWGDAIPAGAQILDLELHDGRFYGSGSTISQPPYFYYEPSGGMGNAFAFEVVDLAAETDTIIRGEAWGLAMGEGGEALVAGVDEDADVAVLWFSDDPTTSGTWNLRSYNEITAPTRFYGACRSGDVLVAVGDYSQRTEAFMAVSTDGGAQWTTLDPPGPNDQPAGSLSTCQIVDDTLFVVGADGYFAAIDTADL